MSLLASPNVSLPPAMTSSETFAAALIVSLMPLIEYPTPPSRPTVSALARPKESVPAVHGKGDIRSRADRVADAAHDVADPAEQADRVAIRQADRVAAAVHGESDIRGRADSIADAGHSIANAAEQADRVAAGETDRIASTGHGEGDIRGRADRVAASGDR